MPLVNNFSQFLGCELSSYGSPNFLYPSSFEDSYAHLAKKIHGQKALPGFDFENADYVLSFGSGIIEGWGSPVRMFRPVPSDVLLFDTTGFSE
ncbi:MAG: hypothetical protein R6W74_06885, partial [Nitrosomonas halophila]